MIFVQYSGIFISTIYYLQIFEIWIHFSNVSTFLQDSRLLKTIDESQNKKLLNLLKMLKFSIKVYLNYILTCCRFWKFYIPGLFRRCEPFNKKEIGKWWFRQSRKLLFRWSEKKISEAQLTCNESLPKMDFCTSITRKKPIEK